MPDFIEVTTRMGHTILLAVKDIKSIRKVNPDDGLNYKTVIDNGGEDGDLYLIIDHYRDVVRHLRRVKCSEN